MEFYRFREVSIAGRTIQLGKRHRMEPGSDVVGEKNVMLIGQSSVGSPSIGSVRAHGVLRVVFQDDPNPVLLATSLIGNWLRENVYTKEQVERKPIRLQSRIPFVHHVVTAA